MEGTDLYEVTRCTAHPAFELCQLLNAAVEGLHLRSVGLRFCVVQPVLPVIEGVPILAALINLHSLLLLLLYDYTFKPLLLYI